jgi:hypothetical protein
VASRLKLLSQFKEVVDLTVTDGGDSPVLIEYWLVTSGNIYNCEALHTKHELVVRKESSIIWTTMPLSATHIVDDGWIKAHSGPVQDSVYTAHVV